MNAKEEDRCQKLIDKIDDCIVRVLKSKPHCTTIRFKDGQWIIKPLGLI